MQLIIFNKQKQRKQSTEIKKNEKYERENRNKNIKTHKGMANHKSNYVQFFVLHHLFICEIDVRIFFDDAGISFVSFVL